MTYHQFLTDTRTKLSEGFSAFCQERGLDPLEVVGSVFDLEKKKLTVCIAPPDDGPTLRTDGRTDVARFFVAIHCNKSASTSGVAQAEKYFSVAYQYLTQTCFGEASTLDDSVLCLMSSGEPLNGAYFLLSARINTYTDYTPLG